MSQEEDRQQSAGPVQRSAPHPFRIALEARDVTAAADALADDVVLYSPVSRRPFEGRAEVAELLRMLLEEELSLLECTDELRSGDRLVLFFRLRIRGRDLEVVDFLKLDDEDKVREYRVLARPLDGAAGYLAALGPRVARRRGRARAAIVKSLGRPLPSMLALADKLGSRLAR